MKTFIILLLNINFTINSCNGQIQDSVYNFKVLNGYFILLRDSIPKINSHVSFPILSFNIFYVNEINQNMIESLKHINRPKSDSIIWISGGTNYSIASSKDHKEYINWLIKNKYFESADKGVLFFDIAKIPVSLIKSKKRFGVIYKGAITVVGPFYPYNKLQLEDQMLYMCLPIASNNTQYICSILF